MKIEVGTVMHGFKTVRIRESAELNARVVEMRHEKVGTELVWIDNGLDNKLFCVGFKTLPEDSTGVFHILEHSVLCGSEKYPVKEPFVDLLKSSMNTFLNAMTFQDKTIYPVSSRNERDFLNLTSVYLDAVFAPRCAVDPNAFRQEGWRLETDENGKPYINGVVYNEMKGATSGIDDILEEGVNSMLFPDNCYGFNSGGDPACIPDLTYEQYVAMYRKYYHPSNARVFLDGAVPLDETLAMIDEYVGGAEKQDAAHEIPMQRPAVRRNTLYYELGPGEPGENRDIVTFAKICGSWADKRRTMMLDVLTSLLADTNDAPLKRALLDAGLGEDVDLSVNNWTAQHFLTLTVRNTSAEKETAIREKTEEVVRELLEKGLDKELLTAQINRYAFRLKDMREPAGLIRCITSYGSSLYGGDPMLYLENDADIAFLRAEAENGGFDRLLEETLADLSDMSVLTVLPSATRGEELRAAEEKRAADIYAAMNDEEKAALKEANDRLHLWQEQPDRPEDTATLPVLPLSEVSPEPLTVPTEEFAVSGVKLMYHRVPSFGITHTALYFNLSDLPFGELSSAALMAELLAKLPTKDHSVSELQKLIKTYIGRLRFGIMSSMRGPEACTPYFAVSFSALDENAAKAGEIVAEILTGTLFSETDRIKEVVLQLDEATKQKCIVSGHTVGMTAVAGHYMAASAAAEATEGYTYRSYIKGLAKDFEAGVGGLVSVMERIRGCSFVRARMTVGMTAVEMNEPALIALFPEGTPAPAEAAYVSPLPEKLGIRIPAQVSFAEKGMFMPEMSGEMKVASNIIGLGLLWNRVRVQGGAYGVGLRATDHGLLCHYTYRDPSPARSLDVFGEEPDFITAFCESGEDMTKFIISAIGRTEPLRSPAESGAAADLDFLDGFTAEKAKKLRLEMLGTNAEALLALRPVLRELSETGCVCVVGCDSALAELEGFTVFDV